MEKAIESPQLDYRQTTRKERMRTKYMNANFVAKVFGNIFTYVIVIGIAFIILYPLFRRIGNAFKPVEEFYDSSVVFFPRNPTFAVIRKAFTDLQFETIGMRSFLLAAFVGVSQTAVALFAGYGFARFKFRGSKLLFMLVIFTLIVPPQTILIPLFLRFRFFDFFGIVEAITGSPINLIDTLWCQILLALTGTGWKNGLYIYMMRQYFRGIPKELEEAAYIDGAKTFKAFFRIMIPSAVPMMMTVLLFSFSWQWTDVFYADTFLNQVMLLPRRVAKIDADKNELMTLNLQQTAILIILVPLILLFIITQRFFVEGIERSGLTG